MSETQALGYTPIEGTSWSLVVAIEKDEILKSLPKVAFNTGSVTLAGILLGIVVSFFIGNAITKPVIEATNMAKKVAALDFTVDNESKGIKKKNEIGLLKESLIQIKKNVRETLINVNKATSVLADEAKQMQEASNESKKASTEVAKKPMPALKKLMKLVISLQP